MLKDTAKVLDRIDSQRRADLTLQLVKIPNPTAQEFEVAKLYASQLKKIGLELRLEDIEPNRPNVIGTLRGKGGGKNLILCGHMDTIPQKGCVAPRSEASSFISATI